MCHINSLILLILINIVKCINNLDVILFDSCFYTFVVIKLCKNEYQTHCHRQNRQ